ncbi:amidohydrolase family protein [Acidovorax sp.]|uniref:amidohydrolase family protein n=1 Tax=Acidovorax sp. TaxID=1872122 RepID=UPI0025899999|nr:amidohydrolase family protein [Acidovorax sp.]
MYLPDEPRIDTHCHIFDPARFAYAADVAYRPSGQETGSADTFAQVMDAYGVRHALLVGPNSGYGLDNRCLLDALARHPQRFKGVAVVRNNASTDELTALQAGGVVGVAFNIALYGVDHYRDIGPLLQRLAPLGLLANVQVQHQQLPEVLPLLLGSGVRVLIDHCGRPDVTAGVGQPGFQALLALGRHKRALVKLSGYAKFSAQPFPWADTRPYVDALLEAFGPEGCLWASDWPFLRAPERIDLGALMQLTQTLLPDAAVRRQVLWETPRRVLGWK